MPRHICAHSLISQFISAKLQSFTEFAHFGQVKSYWEEKMAAALASVFVIASLAHAKPQVAISFCLCLWSSWNTSRLALASPPPPPPPWSRGCRTRAPPCQAAPASSPSSTTGRPTSSAHTLTRQLPGEDPKKLIALAKRFKMFLNVNTQVRHSR